MHLRHSALALAALALSGVSSAAFADTTHVIDFDSLEHGEFVSQVSSAGGLGPVYIDGVNPNNPYENSAVAFDSGTPTSTDLDLGTPNEIYGGPGVGSAGASNDTAQGRLLIVSGSLIDGDGDGLVDAPDDLVAQGTQLEIDFSALPAPCYGAATVTALRVVDIESYEASSYVTFLDRFGGTLLTQNLTVTGDNGTARMEFGAAGVPGVERIVVVINGSGAIDDIEFSCPDDTPPPPPPPTCGTFVCEGGVTNMTLRYIGSADDVTVTVTDKKGSETFGTFSGIDFADTFYVASTDDKKGKFPSEIVVHVFDGSTEIETTPIHVSCSQPIDIGYVFGSFSIDALTARGDNGKKKDHDDDDSCGNPPTDTNGDGAPCEGGLSDITLEYAGDAANVTVTITDKKGDNEIVSFGNVDKGDILYARYDPNGKKDKFPSEITVHVYDGDTLLSSTGIHVSCSQPIAPGFVYGDFVVKAFTSRGGGTITENDGTWTQTGGDDDSSSRDDDSSSKDDDSKSRDDDSKSGSDDADALCKGGLTDITVEYIGAIWNAVVVLTDKKGDNVLATFESVHQGDQLFAQYDPAVKKDKFPSEIVFNVYDGDTLVESTPIHVSCSQPIAPGFVYDNFVVQAFTSKDGGAVAALVEFPTVRINAGGSTYIDGSGDVWAADTDFSGGSEFQRPSLGIDGTLDDALYQSERYGNFSYDVPVPDGLYEVTLKTAEIFWQTSGSRVFDVMVEGEVRAAAVDIYDVAGYATAHDITLLVEVRDGMLNLDFATVADNAKLGAIEIDRLGSLGPEKASKKRKGKKGRKPRRRRGRARR